MLVRKFRVVVKSNEQLLCSRLHSSRRVLKYNLKDSCSNYLRSSKTNLFYTNNSNHIISRHLGKLSESLQTNNEEDKNNYFQNDDHILREPSENLFAYNLLLNNPKLKSTIMPRLVLDDNVTEEMVNQILNKKYEDLSLQEILDDFKKLSVCPQRGNLIITDPKLDNILILLTKHLPSYTNEELKDILRCLELWDRKLKIYTDQSHPLPYFQLLHEIDKDCFLRLNDFQNEDYLILCDLFWRVRYLRAKFVGKAVIKLGRQSKQLKPEHFLQYLFTINASRRAFKNMYELEYTLELFFLAYNAEELAIACMAFFKTRTRFYNPLLQNKIISKFIEEMESVGDIALCALFKILRISFGLRETDTLRALIEAFRPKVPTVSGVCLVHVAHAITALHIYNKKFMDEAVKRFQKLIPVLRAKDLERILLCVETFKYPKEHPIYNLIVQELRSPERADELAMYPQCLSIALMYLSHVGIYPLDIIVKVLSHEYLQKTFKMNPVKIGREYLSFSTSLQIEVPEYDGPLLPEKVANYLKNRYSTDPINYDADMETHVPQSQRFLLEVITLLKDILGACSFLTDQLLPHYSKQDIVLCMDKNKNFVSPRPHFPQAGTVGVIKYAPIDPEEHKWLVLLLAPRNLIFNKPHVTFGLYDYKLRQLQKLGYHPIPLLSTDWISLTSTEDRKKYLRNLLFAN